MKFDPTINSGHIVQILVIAGGIFVGWSTMDKQVAAQAIKTEQLEKQAAADRERFDAALKEFKGELREVSKAIGDVKQDVTFLRGRAADVGGKK